MYRETMKEIVIVIVLCSSLLVTAVPTDRHKRGPNDLSDKEHYDEEHNLEYDHEAFLGKEQASEFDQLSHEESRRRLGILVTKIDKDGDGYVTEEELKDWVKHVSYRYVYDNVDESIPIHDQDGDGKIGIEEYLKSSYGEVEDENSVYDSHRKLSYKDMMNRDRRRYEAADTDKNGFLDREEFASFLHPQDMPHMREIVIQEALDDMDKDKDGYVTIEEYIQDIWPDWERHDGETEPEWVVSEREQFFQHRDSDKDKRLSKRELEEWIAPDGFDPAEAESRHLIYNADKDKDKKLTKEEILDNQDLFVGSQATDFGSYLYKHDEF